MKNKHQTTLLEGLDRLRTERISTDVTLVSGDGQHYSVHYLVLQALDISNIVPNYPFTSKVNIKASGTALNMIISYLYRGNLDLSIADESTIEEIEKIATNYHVDLLKQVILEHRKKLTDCIARKNKSTACAVSSNSSIKALKPPVQHDINLLNCGENRAISTDGYKTLSRNLNQEKRESTSEGTKSLLKAFLSKKVENKKIEVESNKCLNQETTIRHHATTVCCALCGKLISRRGFLAHMRIHENVKNKTCEVCGKRFRKACNLKEHWERMHSSVKGYCCDRCGSSFAIKSDLTRHLARHQKTCFVCELCGASFVGKMKWKKHKCMDDIFNSDDLETVFPEENASNASSSHPDDIEEDILSISTLLPLGFSDNGSKEILSEIDGLFYETRARIQGSDNPQF